MSDTATLSQLFAGIDADLDAVDRTFQERTASDLGLLQAAVTHALNSQGKRLRIALTLLSGKLIDYRFDKLLPLAVSLEMVHLASLVHDDIVDHAATRRGLPTVNSVYGDGVAILLGDYLFAKTSGIVAEIEDFRIDRLFAETVARISEGTIIELLSARKVDLSLETYIDRISRKTAVLMAACCKGGATVAGGSDAQINLMEGFGHNLGIAFQVIDDVLDYTGTDASIGKPAGNDLRQGLVTSPLIYALRHEQNGRMHQITKILKSDEPADTDVNDVVRWVTSGPAVHEALDLARMYGARARALLTEFPSSPDRKVLEELVDFVLARTR